MSSGVSSNIFCLYVVATVSVVLLIGETEVVPITTESYSRKGNVGTNLKEIRKSEGWGFPDVLTSFGTMFQYQLPKQDEHGLYLHYQVASVGEDILPNWLYWNTTKNLLEGVAEREMLWEIYNIQVTANYQYHNGTTVLFTEYFTITVTDGKMIKKNNNVDEDLHKSMSTDLKPIECRLDAAVTKATVIIDADLTKLLPQERSTLLRNMCSFLKLPINVVNMLPLGSKEILDASALVAGPGDIKLQINSNPLTIQWLVGCGNVYADQMPILVLLEISSLNGSMSNAIGYGVVGWYITNSKKNNYKTASRLKRQEHYINPTATPMPSAVRPTYIPVPTQTVSEMSDIDVPETRISPTATRPLFPEIEATKIPVDSFTQIQPSITYASEITDVVTEFMSTIEKSTWRRDEIEPSISIFPTTSKSTATEILPRFTTRTDNIRISDIITPSLATGFISASAIVRITPKITKKPPKKKKVPTATLR